MSRYDYSGLDRRAGRWWGFWGATLMIIGAFTTIVGVGAVIYVITGIVFGD